MAYVPDMVANGMILSLDKGAYPIELAKVKRTIVGSCEKCEGRGYYSEGELDVETLSPNITPCKCSELWHFRLKQMKANLPKEFWDIKWSDIVLNIDCFKSVRGYLKKIDSALEHGLGFLMIGENGVGKTSAGALIINHVIKCEFSAFYVTCHDLADALYKSIRDDEVAQGLEDKLDCDFLVLDELDKIHMKAESTFLQSKLDSILRRRISTLKPTIIVTNMTEMEISDNFGASIMSILAGRLKQLRFVPGDFRKEQRKSWEALLES